jgi:hypothetical protein
MGCFTSMNRSSCTGSRANLFAAIIVAAFRNVGIAALFRVCMRGKQENRSSNNRIDSIKKNYIVTLDANATRRPASH